MHYSDETYAKVCKCVERSFSVELEDISPEKFLIKDLGADSIDLLDLVHEIDAEFGVSFSIANIQKMAKDRLHGLPFEQDSVITPEAIAELKRILPLVPDEKFTTGMMVQEIPFLLTVGSLAQLIDMLLENNKSIQ